MRIAAVLLAATAIGACGGEAETEQDRVRAAVLDLQSDMAANRLGAVCAAMAAAPRRQVGSVGHGRRPTTCRRDLGELVANSAQPVALWDGKDLRRTRKPEVLDVELAPRGERATVTLGLGGDPYELPMVKEGGSWKLADFFGAQAPAPPALR